MADFNLSLSTPSGGDYNISITGRGGTYSPVIAAIDTLEIAKGAGMETQIVEAPVLPSQETLLLDQLDQSQPNLIDPLDLIALDTLEDILTPISAALFKPLPDTVLSAMNIPQGQIGQVRNMATVIATMELLKGAINPNLSILGEDGLMFNRSRVLDSVGKALANFIDRKMALNLLTTAGFINSENPLTDQQAVTAFALDFAFATALNFQGDSDTIAGLVQALGESNPLFASYTSIALEELRAGPTAEKDNFSLALIFKAILKNIMAGDNSASMSAEFHSIANIVGKGTAGGESVLPSYLA